MSEENIIPIQTDDATVDPADDTAAEQAAEEEEGETSDEQAAEPPEEPAAESPAEEAGEAGTTQENADTPAQEKSAENDDAASAEESVAAETSPADMMEQEDTAGAAQTREIDETEESSVAPGQEKTAEKTVTREVAKELTAEDRAKIFEDQLKENLSTANQAKLQSYEKHLQAIVDFIENKRAMVSNQDIEEGLNIPDSTVTDRLNELIKRGIVVKMGNDRNTKYRLKKAI